MWQYRELVWNLTVTDLRKRYQGTFLGFFWSLLSPFLMALVLYFVFRHLFGADRYFAVELLVGIMAWNLFGNTTAHSLSAIVGNATLVTRVYIPRRVLVLSNVLASIVNSLLSFAVLLPILFVLLGYYLPPAAFLFPIIHLVYFWFLYGVGLLLAAFYVYFRDLDQIWDVVLRTLFFLSPIFYPLTMIPERFMPYYLLNPITQFMIAYREMMIRGGLPSLHTMATLLGVGIATWLVGIVAFHQLQRRFAEEL